MLNFGHTAGMSGSGSSIGNSGLNVGAGTFVVSSGSNA